MNAWRWFDDRTRDWDPSYSMWKIARWPLLAAVAPAVVHWYWLIIVWSWRQGAS